MEDVLPIVAEYLYTSKVYYDKINVKINDVLLHKYNETIKGQSFLNKKYLLQPIMYPYRLVRQTNGSPKEQICKYDKYHPLDSKRRGPEELYKTAYKDFT
jgi:hypothetical protein